MLRLWLLLSRSSAFTFRSGSSSRGTGSSFFGDGLSVVGFVPLSEGGGIDLDYGSFDEGVGSDEFVVRGVVDYGDYTGFDGDGFGAPGVVAFSFKSVNRLLVETTPPGEMNLPLSNRNARYLWLPPRVRTVWMRLTPSLVLAA